MPFLSDFINQAPTYRRGLLSNLRGFAQDTQSQQQVGQGLLDAANRGLVAQTLGAPVDIANSLTNLLYAGAGYAGNKLGLLNADQMPQIPDPRTVVGSSEWWGNKLQQGGFVSENRNQTAETLAGLLAPAAYKGATKVGQGLFKTEQNMLANAAKPSTMTMQGQRGVVNIGSMPKIDELTGLPLNGDGTVTVYHHTSASNADAIRKTGRLKSAAEPDVYVTTRNIADTGYGDTVVPVRVKPSMLQIDDEFPSGRIDFRIGTGRPGGSIPITIDK